MNISFLRNTAVLSLLFCSLAPAGTLYGPSGLILYPSAHVAPSASTMVGLSVFSARPPGGGTQHWLSLTGAIGLGGKAEVGVAYLRRTGGGTNEALGGAGKYNLLGESLLTPAVSVGVDVIGGDLRTQQAYVVASKQILPSATQHPLTVTAGGYYVDFRDGVRRSSQDLYAGADFRLAKSLNALGEWRSRTKFNLKASSSVALKWSAKRYSLRLGMANDGNSGSHRPFLGAGLNLSPFN